jgi:competence protein ComEC
MPYHFIPAWKNAPFLRLLIPLITGIIIQWYFQAQLLVWAVAIVFSLLLFFIFFFLPFFTRYRLAFITGVSITVTFVAAGALLTSQNDIRNDHNWFGNSYTHHQSLVVTLIENPVEKTKSYKADAAINYFIEHDVAKPATGKIILYFAKDRFPANLDYGSVVILDKPLQEIKNAGNPGGFDYRRFCLFKGITHQVYLSAGDYVSLKEKKENRVTVFINKIKKNVLAIVRTYIPGEKEKGLAEALLIGYKDDLDKTLIQSYSNTGVVHIIAISGLHLGLIYWLLVQLLKPLERRKHTRWLSTVIIITGLWLFSILAGAQPSVLRAAVMFTCIAVGNSIGRKSSIFNSLAASAFFLLCYNPYWLWDVGFQLSYAAVLSIVIYMQAIYNLLYFKNRILDFLWKMNAVTIAAQLLTVPISIYHFHQFPDYFLLTNFIAVPLSSLILLGEILLCIVSFIPVLAAMIGKMISAMIWFMNTWVERVEALPFSLWDGLQISIIQAILLLVFIGCLSYWLLEKQKKGLVAGLIALFGFVLLRSISIIQAQGQQKIIVYNVPGKNAIDIINGNTYAFIGDSGLVKDDFSRNFHLKPSRILNRAIDGSVIALSQSDKYFSFNGKHVLLLNEEMMFSEDPADKPELDLLILSGNSKLYISKLAGAFTINRVVIDGSVPASKSNYWKRDCDSLHIPWHDVSEKGAFVMNLR